MRLRFTRAYQAAVFTQAVIIASMAYAGYAAGPMAPGQYATPDQVQNAIQAAQPQPSAVSPPPTGNDSATGSATAYARADHTHATSVQRTAMTVSPTGQPVRWTFVKPYDTGIVPVVVCTAQNTASATRPFVVNVVGDPTNTYADIIVFQAAQPTISLLGASVTLFAQAGSGTKVNCQAAKPTQ